MTCRILMIAMCALVLGGRSVSAQQAALGPHSSVLFVPPVVAADSATLRPTYWKEGAIVGGAIGGVLGYLVSGLCGMDDPGADCGLARIAGVVIGFGVGAIPGALIGGQIEKQ